jgi:glutamyl-tRNA synthetase
MQKIRTRFAPSPTGFAHIGNFRTAYFNWLFSKNKGGDFLLRIDDTDLARNRTKATDIIYQTMDWLKLDYTFLFNQSDAARQERYREVSEKFLQRGFAIREGEGEAIVIKPVKELQALGVTVPTEWFDQLSGRIRVDLNQLDHLVIKTSSGSFLYNFTSIIDDSDSEITDVIRGTDHQQNTPKQILIQELYRLSFPERSILLPRFHHIGLIFKDGQKMSKRENAASLMYYREQGYHPEAILNFLLRMGWGPRVDDKTAAMISKERAIGLFSEGKMKGASSNFDQAKLDSYNRKYKALDKKAGLI